MSTPTNAPKPGAHALLGASGAHRWLNCPPSARLCEDLPDNGSFNSREGSIAHELAALQLQQHFTPRYTKSGYTRARNAILKAMAELYEKEQPQDAAGRATHGGVESAVNEYADLVKDMAASYAERPFVAIEQRVDYRHIAPEGFGTCDCLLIGRVSDSIGNRPIRISEANRGAEKPQSGLNAEARDPGRGPRDYWQLRVVDYKHGKGVPVHAEQNPQLMLYALGALRMLSAIYPISEVALTICQPRLNSITEWVTTPDALAAWGESVKSTARQAFEGAGDMREGDWCKFCKMNVTCRARAARFTALEDFGFPQPGTAALSDAELGAVLTIGVRLDSWLEQLRKYAKTLLLSGGELPGWKMIEGQSRRAFSNQDEAFRLAKVNGVAEDMLYVREPITLTALETLMGKKPFAAALESQIIRKPSAPILVPESDPRPQLITTTSAAEDFAAQPM